ncbi:MAG: hypothetical protein JXB85_01985 [Anaerolineales bacterium]|nr:hypothetical protein [Anaerolineales bacterium]
MQFFSSPLFYILIGFGVGILLGKTDTLFMSSRKNRKETEKIKDLEAQVAALEDQLSSRAAGPEPALKVYQDEANQWRLDLDGASPAPEAIQSEQRRRLIAILTVLRPWVEAGPAAPAPQRAPASAPVRPQPAPVPLAQAAPVPHPAEEPDESSPGPKSIVRQIDEVLQRRLAGTPLGMRGVRLTESLSGGVTVWIGSEKYDGVDAVTDPEVKGAIRAAISEWETRPQ